MFLETTKSPEPDDFRSGVFIFDKKAGQRGIEDEGHVGF